MGDSGFGIRAQKQYSWHHVFLAFCAKTDGIVVPMAKRIDLDEYFRLPETNRPQELVFGT